MKFPECYGASPEIRNNLLAGNLVVSSGFGGGGISCYASSAPLIVGNRLLYNRAKGTQYGGGGIFCESSTAVKIINNTLIGNLSTLTPNSDRGGGIRSQSTRTLVVNNLIAFGSSAFQGVFPSNLRNNCVFGNLTNNVANPAAGNISVDPRLLRGAAYFDVHLLPDSPCIDAGDSSQVSTNDTDFDGQLRVQGAGVDIGADEFGGTTPQPVVCRIIRVTPSGDDAGDGSTWSLAKRTLQAALEAAVWDGPTEVWVAAGSYAERITLQPFAHLYGGFDETETIRDQRNWKSNQSVLDGNQSGSVVTALVGGEWSTVDGFTIRNGLAVRGGGVFFDGASPTLANNTIRDNTATASLRQDAKGGGIYCFSSFAVISNNVLEANSATLGGAIYTEAEFKTEFSGPLIVNNQIVRNRTTNSSNAVWGGAGIYATFSSPTIANNLLTQNVAQTNLNGLSFGGALYFQSAHNALVANNTIVGNVASNGAGICLINASPRIANNIFAFAGSGLFGSTSSPELRNNCVFGNADSNYQGLPDPTGTDGNLSVDPLFVDGTGDFHLRTNSPCIDGGDDLLADLGWLDFDGQARIQGTHVDIGADETVQPGSWQRLIATTNLVQVVVTSVGGITYAQFSVTLPDSCHRLWDVAPLVRSGNNFERDFKLAIDTGDISCLDSVTVVEGAFVLGKLAQGNYALTVLSWGDVVQTIPFAVPAQVSNTLLASVETNGLFRLRLDGIGRITYVIQASADLAAWTAINTNVGGPFAFTDPETTNASQRFYRALIGP